LKLIRKIDFFEISEIIENEEANDWIRSWRNIEKLVEINLGYKNKKFNDQIKKDIKILKPLWNFHTTQVLFGFFLV
jgi:hypothetical protein